MKRIIGVVIAAVLLLTSCAGQREEKPLTICVDSYYENAVSDLVDAWERLNEGYKAELVVIPADVDAAEIKVTELRTELMSGGGPDVFIMEGVHPNVLEQTPVLFPNPEQMMYAEVFLPLDEYMEHAQYMDLAACNRTVMASGRTEEGQLLLPIAYVYYASLLRTSDLTEPESLPASWEEWLACEDRALIKGTVNCMLLAFHNLFVGLVDYQKGELLFSEEELLERTREAIAFSENSLKIKDAPKEIAGGIVGERFLSALAGTTEEYTLFAFPDTDGGITANVTMYAAVNRNTEQAEKAFSILDLLFSEEIMCGYGFQIGERWNGSMVMSHFLMSYNGMPVYNGALQNQFGRMTQEKLDAVLEMNSRIQTVCYDSDFSKALAGMYEEYRYTRGEKEREEIIRQTYRELQMKLLE